MSDAKDKGPERIWLDAKSMLLSWICVSSLTEYIRADLYESVVSRKYHEDHLAAYEAKLTAAEQRVEDGIEALNASERIRARLVAENIELKGRVEDERLRETANSQAEDEGLWFEAQTAPEAYLQQELRRLHEIIEGKTGDECAREVVAGYSPTPPDSPASECPSGCATRNVCQDPWHDEASECGTCGGTKGWKRDGVWKHHSTWHDENPACPGYGCKPCPDCAKEER